MTHEGMGRRRSKGGDEYDVYTDWRRVLAWTKRAGATKRVKTGTHRRERRQWRMRNDDRDE